MACLQGQGGKVLGILFDLDCRECVRDFSMLPRVQSLISGSVRQMRSMR